MYAQEYGHNTAPQKVNGDPNDVNNYSAAPSTPVSSTPQISDDPNDVNNFSAARPKRYEMREEDVTILEFDTNAQKGDAQQDDSSDEDDTGSDGELDPCNIARGRKNTAINNDLQEKTCYCGRTGLFLARGKCAR